MSLNYLSANVSIIFDISKFLSKKLLVEYESYLFFPTMPSILSGYRLSWDKFFLFFFHFSSMLP
jgi:hypothetical protein|uniref:Uncharacterized protein n=1 Tax=virus sp. ctPYc18 TaxID=2828251 RepID=A0A8S5RCD4_9VIRU|nr:MAG TPA: hypothetical protein [virus sp. ctPYc18]